MADGVSFKMVTEPARKGIDSRAARMPAAARWAVRQAARETARAAKQVTPVLKASGTATHSQLQKQRRQGGDVSGTYDRPVPGLLKASIKPSKHVKTTGTSVSLKVGPRGQRAHLYADKIEERAHYMDRGQAAGEAAIETYAITAFNRVWRG